MAKKVLPVNIPPPPSSSDDETQDRDSSSSATDDEQQPQHPTLSQNQEPQNEDSDDETEDDEPEPVVKKPSLQEPQESEESDDDSDADSDETQNYPSACAFTVMPIVSKPVSKSPEPKTSTSKPARVKSSAKRPEETDKATKAVSKNQQPGKVNGGNNKRHAEVEKVEKSKNKMSKVSNGEGQNVGKVEKGSKGKVSNGEGQSVGKVEKGSKGKVSNGEGQSVGKVEKGSKGKVSNGEGQSVGKVEKGSKGKVSNGEGHSVGKVQKGSKSKVSNGEGQSVGIVESGSKSKKGTSGDDESGQVEEKKSLVKWSEEDEVKLLDEIFDYTAETGEDVNSDVVAFYNHVKYSFSVNLMKNQLYEKVRRLKKKFKTNADKWETGEEPVFSKPHDSELFELSKKIWGSEVTVTDGNDKKDGNVVGNTSTPVEPVTSREHFVQEEIRDTIMENEEEVTQDFWLLYPRLCASLESEAVGFLSQRVEDLKEYVEGIIAGMGEEKARELEYEWKAFHVMDHQLYARRAHLISKQAQIATDLFNQS